MIRRHSHITRTMTNTGKMEDEDGIDHLSKSIVGHSREELGNTYHRNINMYKTEFIISIPGHILKENNTQQTTPQVQA